MASDIPLLSNPFRFESSFDRYTFLVVVTTPKPTPGGIITSELISISDAFAVLGHLLVKVRARKRVRE